MRETKLDVVSAGRTFAGFFLEAERADAAPGVLVLHGGAGLGAHERDRARMLTELGYHAFAPDLFGERFETRERGVEVITRLVGDPLALRTRLADALGCLASQPMV